MKYQLIFAVVLAAFAIKGDIITSLFYA